LPLFSPEPLPTRSRSDHARRLEDLARVPLIDDTVRVLDLADGRCVTRGPAGGKPSALSGVSREGRVALEKADYQVVFLTLYGLAPAQASRHSSGVI
jgi:hypothetical protein